MRPHALSSKIAIEQELWPNYSLLAGVDEAGMGCLAGPVVAAAVIFDPLKIPDGIDDSKKLSPQKRAHLKTLIESVALSFAIGTASVAEIDQINIYWAGKLAMERAVRKLSIKPDYVILDGRGQWKLEMPGQFIIHGDQLSVSIGAASILAKVTRDEMMLEYDALYPGYGFANHKGYGSIHHRKQLQTLGSTEIHRKTFQWKPV